MAKEDLPGRRQTVAPRELIGCTGTNQVLQTVDSWEESEVMSNENYKNGLHAGRSATGYVGATEIKR